MKDLLTKTVAPSNPTQRQQVRWEVGQKIQAALQSAQELSPNECLQEIRDCLSAIELDCRAIEKSFIVVEESITCAQYELGGHSHDTAILFRGPREDASVAICVTSKGSLLHRNSSPWRIYRNAGDVNPG